MSKNEFPNFPLPGVGDGLDFVKKLWSGMAVPNAIAPTMDVDELDKRIADLRAVEQWLQLNLTMLRGTIQGMEVQRATVATLKGFGRALSGKSDQEQLAALHAMAFSNSAAAQKPVSAPKKTPLNTKSSGKRSSGNATAAAVPDAGMITPNAWFNMLSEQFTKIAQATTNAGIDVAGKTVGKAVEKTVGAAAGKTAEMVTKTAAHAVTNATNDVVNKAARTATGAARKTKGIAGKVASTAVGATRRR